MLDIGHDCSVSDAIVEVSPNPDTNGIRIDLRDAKRSPKITANCVRAAFHSRGAIFQFLLTSRNTRNISFGPGCDVACSRDCRAAGIDKFRNV